MVVDIPSKIRRFVREELRGVYTTSLAIVEEIDRENARLVVSLKRDEEVLIDHVPIAGTFAGDGYGHIVPIQEGDEGILLHTKCPLEDLIIEDGHIDIRPHRQFSQIDALFFPQIWYDNQEVPDHEEGEWLIYHPSDTFLSINPDGDIHYQHENGNWIQIDEDIHAEHTEGTRLELTPNAANVDVPFDDRHFTVNEFGIDAGRRVEWGWFRTDPAWADDHTLVIDTPFSPSYIEFWGNRHGFEEENPANDPHADDLDEDDDLLLDSFYSSADAPTHLDEPEAEARCYGIAYPSEYHERDDSGTPVDYTDPKQYCESYATRTDEDEYVSYITEAYTIALFTQEIGNTEETDYLMFAKATVEEFGDDNVELLFENTEDSYFIRWRAVD